MQVILHWYEHHFINQYKLHVWYKHLFLTHVYKVRVCVCVGGGAHHTYPTPIDTEFGRLCELGIWELTWLKSVAF